MVDSSHTARLRNVTIGRDFGTSLEILSGLQPQDLVVLNPPDSLSDGDPVSIQQTDNSAPGAPTKPATATPNASGKTN